MDFEVPGEYRELTDSFTAFLDREVRPVEDRFRQRLQEDEWDEEMRQAGLALRHRSAELGFYGAYMPEEVGGWGLSNLAYTLLVEAGATTGLR